MELSRCFAITMLPTLHGAIGKRKLEKNQGFTGIRTLDLRDTGAVLYQLSYEVTHWERGQFIEFISSRAVK